MKYEESAFQEHLLAHFITFIILSVIRTQDQAEAQNCQAEALSNNR